MKSGFIQTYTGRLFYPLDPDWTEIDVLDVAHGLSNVCRFAGQAVRSFYSVAEHCVIVSQLVESRGGDRDAQLWGLLHDASEAYLGDMPRPLKYAAGFGEVHRQAEHRLMLAVCRAFGLGEYEPALVDQADADLLLAEQRDLIGEPACGWSDWLHGKKMGSAAPVDLSRPMLPEAAEVAFLSRYSELSGR